MSDIKWQHEISAKWLRERRKVLTATEIRDLIPALKRYKKNGDVSSFVGVWGDKHATPLVEETWAPSNAAARGHILEPYAVEEYNIYKGQLNPKMYHWDDFIIVDSRYHVGYSPDAMNIVQPPKGCSIEVEELLKFKPSYLLEIKCYEPKHHMQAVYSSPENLKERYQLAAAMAITPTIEEGALLFYCPQCEIGIDTKQLTRDDLEKEIKECCEVIDVWAEVCGTCKKLFANAPTLKYSEKDIYDEFVSELTDPLSL